MDIEPKNRWKDEKVNVSWTRIDEDTFFILLSEIKQIDEHNQNLEDELQFLEQIKSSYQQLLEQQLGYKRVCESYGENNLKLSDLSQIDIDYIDKRINNIIPIFF